MAACFRAEARFDLRVSCLAPDLVAFEPRLVGLSYGSLILTSLYSFEHI